MCSPHRTDDPSHRTGEGATGLVRFSDLPPGVLRDIALVWLADAVVGVSFGAIAVGGGLPVWVPVLMSLLVYAGSAQFSAVGVLTAGGGPVAAAATGLLLNSRTAAFSLALADDLGRSWTARLIGAHLVTDETAAFVLAQEGRRQRKAAFWISGVGLFVAWNLSVLAGALAGSALGDTDRFGLDAAFPAVLLALVLPALRGDSAARRASAVGAVVAVASAPLLPAGVPVLLALLGLLAARRGPRRPRTASSRSAS
ncbi:MULTISPECIES: AzlC family ABC transporter permease [Streptomyces]|uniref:Branched-chain amino acid permease n=4 Tax=Streptomyces TaxID=1883 RepID=A0A5P2BDZ6_STRVZ|nr:MULTISPECIES: AzlC family ABC transporter permease [Streptomyces]MYZ15164.1 branched-chain amino acid ABC transporter permease [Streptomyces sp. SID337]QES28732.1 branched-chain amino acid permease [Streptomyces venezuelae]